MTRPLRRRRRRRRRGRDARSPASWRATSCASRSLEAGRDVGAGTSKANTAILHTGFDAKPGHARGAARAPRLRAARRLRGAAPASRSSAPARCSSPGTTSSSRALPGIAAKAARERLHATAEVVDADELYAARAAPRARRARRRSRSRTRRSSARGRRRSRSPPRRSPAACDAAARARAVTGVDGSAPAARALLTTRRRRSHAAGVVNAAGLRGDEVDRDARPRRLHGHAAARRADRLRQARPPAACAHILLPVPTATTKGVLVAPTVFGNVMLGPTAEDVADKTDTALDRDGPRAPARERGGGSCPRCSSEEVTAVYAGLRAATEHARLPDRRRTPTQRLRLRRRASARPG